MAENVIVELTREQAQAVMNATELLARLHIGQFREITEEFGDRFVTDDKKFDSARRDHANDLLEQACRTIFGVNQYGWPDIGEKDETQERCWAVYAMIRYALAWNDHPEGHPWSVAFNEPLGYGEPLPKCEVQDDDKN